MKVTANGIQIEVEDSGGEGRPVILLTLGLGMQLIAWPARGASGGRVSSAFPAWGTICRHL